MTFPKVSYFFKLILNKIIKYNMADCQYVELNQITNAKEADKNKEKGMEIKNKNETQKKKATPNTKMVFFLGFITAVVILVIGVIIDYSLNQSQSSGEELA
jgi:cytochrome b subunit of formate dehydrogenase